MPEAAAATVAAATLVAPICEVAEIAPVTVVPPVATPVVDSGWSEPMVFQMTVPEVTIKEANILEEAPVLPDLSTEPQSAAACPLATSAQPAAETIPDVFEMPVDAMDTGVDVHAAQLNLDSDIALLDAIVPESAEVTKPMVMDDEMDEQIPFLL